MSKILIERELLHDLTDMAHDEAYRQSVGANASRPEKQAKLDKTVADAYALLQTPAQYSDIVSDGGLDPRIDTKGSRKALGAMNAKLKAKIGRLERELAALKTE